MAAKCTEPWPESSNLQMACELLQRKSPTSTFQHFGLFRHLAKRSGGEAGGGEAALGGDGEPPRAAAPWEYALGDTAEGGRALVLETVSNQHLRPHGAFFVKSQRWCAGVLSGRHKFERVRRSDLARVRPFVVLLAPSAPQASITAPACLGGYWRNHLPFHCPL